MLLLHRFLYLIWNSFIPPWESITWQKTKQKSVTHLQIKRQPTAPSENRDLGTSTVCQDLKHFTHTSHCLLACRHSLGRSAYCFDHYFCTSSEVLSFFFCQLQQKHNPSAAAGVSRPLYRTSLKSFTGYFDQPSLYNLKRESLKLFQILA